MKKLSFLLLLVTAVFVLVSCRPAANRSLVFATGGAPAELDFWEAAAADFTKETGIKVEVLRQPTDTDQRRQNLMIALKSRRPEPDVFLMDIAWLAQFQAARWLEPLDAYAAQDQFKTDHFFQNILSLADTRGGRLWALPVYVDAGLLYARQDLLDRYHLPFPQTWQDLVQDCRTIQTGELQAGRPTSGFVWQGAQYEGLVCNFLEFAGSNGGGLKVDGQVQVNTPQNRQALAFMRALIRDHISPPNTYSEMKEEETRLAFQNSPTVFERNWPYAWALHQAADSPVRGKITAGPLPHFPKGESRAALGGWHIGLSKYSGRKAEAWKFIRFVTSFATQKKMVLQLGWNPGRRDVYADPEVLRSAPYLKVLAPVFQTAVPRPMVPYYTELSAVLQRHLHQCLSGEAEPKDALAAAEEECRRVVARYRAP